MELDTITCSDALEYAKTLPDECVDCVVTSPPYFGLRDYGVEGQIGLEETPQAFIARLVELFTEIRRALKKTGVMWVNMGDSYAGYSNHENTNGAKGDNGKQAHSYGTGLASKNLLMIPARLAIAMQDSGWILRSECVWVKPNPMPESVTDRPTKSHEMVYLFAKSQRYFYDADAIREPAQDWGSRDRSNGKYTAGDVPIAGGAHGGLTDGNFADRGRNHRDVFTVNSEPTPYAHFATFPQALIEPFILAGCPEKVCAACGSPYVREMVAVETKEAFRNSSRYVDQHEATNNSTHKGKLHKGMTKVGTDVLHPACTCNAETRAGVVYDPFMGSGTTAIVARRLGRHFIGSELNAEYAALANERLKHNDKQELAAALSGKPTTRPMFAD